MDDACRMLNVEEAITAEQLKVTVKDKIEIKEDGCFSLFEKKDGWERCLDAEEKPCELMTLWTIDPKKNTITGKEPLSEIPCAFIYKKKIFLRDDEKEMSDAVAKNLVYIQALRSVIDSEYPCTPEDAVKLAGLQMQIVYGDHKPGTFVVGFLISNLKQFVPKDLFGTKRPTDWEQSILKAHAQHIGKKVEDVQTEYLDIVKQWPFYGTTFYPPCKSLGTKKLPGKVIIGVNAEGIVLLNKDKELVSTHSFTEICRWESSSSYVSTFAFEFGSQTESQKYTFETKQGAIIAATIQTYLEILVQMLKTATSDSDDEEEV